MIARIRGLKPAAFFRQAAQHALGLGDMLFLAGKVAQSLRQSCLKLGLPRFGAGLLALQRIALHAQPVQHRRARCLFVAKRLQFLRGLSLLTQRLTFSLGLAAHGAERILEGGLGLIYMGASALPMEVMRQGF